MTTHVISYILTYYATISYLFMQRKSKKLPLNPNGWKASVGWYYLVGVKQADGKSEG